MSHYHLHHYHLPRMKEMGRVYWCHSIGAFGVSLALIFVPIYLLKIGYSFQEVLAYIVLQQAFSFLIQVPVNKLFRFISPHHMMVLGSVSQIVFFGLLISLQSTGWPLALLALIWSLERTIYWSAFHYVFAEARAHERSGQQIAGISALFVTATTAAPAIGGIIATQLGINYTYILVIALLFLSVMPMLKLNQGPPTFRFKFSLKKLNEMKRDALSNCFNGIVTMGENNLWPLTVYLIVTSYAGIGILSSVIAIASVIVTLYVGRKSDEGIGDQYLRRGLRTYSITSIGRSLVQSSTQVFGLNLLAGVGRSLYVTPFMNHYYSNSDAGQRLGYITIMEAAHSMGAMLFMLTLLLLSLILSAKIVLSIGLLIVGLAVLGVRLIR